MAPPALPSLAYGPSTLKSFDPSPRMGKLPPPEYPPDILLQPTGGENQVLSQAALQWDTKIRLTHGLTRPPRGHQTTQANSGKNILSARGTEPGAAMSIPSRPLPLVAVYPGHSRSKQPAPMPASSSAWRSLQKTSCTNGIGHCALGNTQKSISTHLFRTSPFNARISLFTSSSIGPSTGGLLTTPLLAV